MARGQCLLPARKGMSLTRCADSGHALLPNDFQHYRAHAGQVGPLTRSQPRAVQGMHERYSSTPDPQPRVVAFHLGFSVSQEQRTLGVADFFFPGPQSACRFCPNVDGSGGLLQPVDFRSSAGLGFSLLPWRSVVQLAPPTHAACPLHPGTHQVEADPQKRGSVSFARNTAETRTAPGTTIVLVQHATWARSVSMWRLEGKYTQQAHKYRGGEDERVGPCATLQPRDDDHKPG